MVSAGVFLAPTSCSFPPPMAHSAAPLLIGLKDSDVASNERGNVLMRSPFSQSQTVSLRSGTRLAAASLRPSRENASEAISRSAAAFSVVS